MPNYRSNSNTSHCMMFRTLPDGFIVNNMLVFGAPAGGYVAIAFEVNLPDLQTASSAERNRRQDGIAKLLRQLPAGWSLQFLSFQDHGDAPRLLAYHQQTDGCSNPKVRILRHGNFITLWQRLEQGKLRRRRTVIFVGRPLASTSGPWGQSQTAAHYAGLLEEARNSFREWQHALEEIVLSLGGRSSALTDADLARLWSNALNPSFGERLGYDPAEGYDLTHSLLDNCWHSELRSQWRQGFVLDGWLHLAFSLKRLPSETYHTIIYRLTHLPFGELIATTHIRRMDREPVLRRTQAALDRIHQQLKRQPNERLAVAAGQLQEKVRRLAGGEVVPLELELIVIVRAKTADELSAMAAAVKSAFHGMNGAQYYEATLPASARNLFAQALPGWMWSRRRGFVHYAEDHYAADLASLASSFPGHPGPVEALFTGADSNLVNVVMFLGQGTAATPQNLIALGATGTGKSLVIAKLLLETQRSFGFTATAEEGLSQAPYTSSFGVEPIVFRLDGRQTINLFDTQGVPLSAFACAC